MTTSRVSLIVALCVAFVNPVFSTVTQATAALELGAYFSYYYFEQERDNNEPAAGHWHGSYYAHPSPRSFPAPDDLGKVVHSSGPAPSPNFPGAEAAPSPLSGITSVAFSTAISTTSEAFESMSARHDIIEPNEAASVASTTTTTTPYRDPNCHTTIQGVPCEDGGQCAVDSVSGWPFCWTSSLDWDWCAIGGQDCDVSFRGEGRNATEPPFLDIAQRGEGGLAECNVAYSAAASAVLPCLPVFRHLSGTYEGCTTASMHSGARWCIVGPYQWEYCRDDCLGGSPTGPAPSWLVPAPAPTNASRVRPAPQRLVATTNPIRLRPVTPPRGGFGGATPSPPTRPPVSDHDSRPTTTTKESQSKPMTSNVPPSTTSLSVAATEPAAQSASLDDIRASRTTWPRTADAVSKTSTVQRPVSQTNPTTTSYGSEVNANDADLKAGDVALSTTIGVVVAIAIIVIVVAVFVVVRQRRRRRQLKLAQGSSSWHVHRRNTGSRDSGAAPSPASSRVSGTASTPRVRAESRRHAKTSVVRFGPSVALSAGKKYRAVSVATSTTADESWIDDDF